jgi:hypothetical protein
MIALLKEIKVDLNQVKFCVFALRLHSGFFGSAQGKLFDYTKDEP